MTEKSKADTNPATPGQMQDSTERFKSLEERKIELEERRIDLHARRLALDEAKKPDTRQGVVQQVLSPVGVAVLTALIALLGQVYVGYMNAETEKAKAQSALVLKVAETEDLKRRAESLVFFADNGLLHIEEKYRNSLRKEAGLGVDDPARAPEAEVPSRMAKPLDPRVPQWKALSQSMYERSMALFAATPGGSQRGRAALQAAIGELEIGSFEEEGVNTGPRIREYLKYCGINFPAPWGPAFATWCYGRRSEPPFVRSAASGLVYRDVLKKGWIHLPGDGYAPQPGDLAVLLRPSATAYLPSQTGIILQTIKEGAKTYLYTIEGNTNGDEGTEGVMVALRKRLYEERQGGRAFKIRVAKIAD